MNFFLADDKINTGYSKNDAEENNCRRRGEGGITATVTVEHIVNVAHDSVHTRGIKICTEEGNRIAIGLECSDKSGNYKIKNGGRNHRQCYFSEHTSLGGSVNTSRIVICLRHRRNRACENKNLKWHNHPDGVKTKHKHLRPVWTVDKVDSRHTEKTKQSVHKSVVVNGGLKEYHKHQANRQGISYVRKEIQCLEKLAKLFDRAEPERNKQGERC